MDAELDFVLVHKLSPPTPHVSPCERLGSGKPHMYCMAAACQQQQHQHASSTAPVPHTGGRTCP
jgi:hypothetical protein